ncbi:MAG: SRPBCC domain-containing protein [Algoriphagus sp.]|jgi:uncharacterized protein YndB with AHSA1/START domain|nr:SRPBCC domain-containing protein [Algoriphagus sp.]
MKKFLILLSLSALVWPCYGQSFSRTYNEATNQISWPNQFEPKKSDFYVHNEIEIQASPERVWQLLIDAGNWPKWYDGIQKIRFENADKRQLELGEKVFWLSMGQSLTNTITEFEPFKRLAWTFLEPKIQGHHAWLILPTANGCKIITDESQTGKLARLQKVFLPRKLIKQHDRWLKLLKEQAEK